MTCTRFPQERQHPLDGGVVVADAPMAPGATSLVTNPNEPLQLVNNQAYDARSAMTVGLRDYLRTLSATTPSGRAIKFEEVFSTWADPEKLAKFPSAVVLGAGDGSYDASKFTPAPQKGHQFAAPDKRFLSFPTELVHNFSIDCWCTDAQERIGVVAMLEVAMLPVDWMYGFRLRLPHYYNVVAEFEPLSMSYADSDEDAVRRIRKASIVVRGRIPVGIVRALLPAQPKLRLAECSPDVTIPPTEF